MLQVMCNTSDVLTAEEFEENMYWQYFCGYEYLDHGDSVSESSICRFRNLLGEAGLMHIQKVDVIPIPVTNCSYIWRYSFIGKSIINYRALLAAPKHIDISCLPKCSF